MVPNKLFKCLILLWCCKYVYSAKILNLGLPMFSHFRNVAFIGDLLVERGHEVWMTATPKLAEKLQLNERNIKTTHFSNVNEIHESVEKLINESVDIYLTTGRQHLNFGTARNLQHRILTDEYFLSQIKEEKFDLIILDNTPIAAMLSLIPYKFDVPFILCGAYYDPMTLRIPFSPAATPHALLDVTDELSLFDTIQVFGWYFILLMYNPLSYYRPAAMYVPEKPYISLVDALRKSQLTLFEYNLMLYYPIPTIPSVIPIGDVTPASNWTIPDNILQFLERSQNGVVVVSFGSLATTYNSPVFPKIVSAFKKTKYNYIIKGDFAKSDHRILAVDWIPQAILLKHPNVKLFITHCGANGVREAMLAGVPMLGFPLFAEQPGNAFRIQARGFGIKMDLYSDSESDIIKTINELIINPMYKNKIKRASDFLNHIKTNATEEAVFWIELILKFGGDYLRSAALDLPFYKYILLDISLIVLVVLIVVFYINYRLLKFICKRMRSRSKTKIE